MSTANLQPETKIPSRRALLAGALGGLGALAASAIGRPQTARAHDVDDVLLGGPNVAGGKTSISTSANNNQVFECDTGSGTAISGVADSGGGVDGSSNSGIGVHGVSVSSYGVLGDSTDGHGVHGHSVTGAGVAGDGRTGVRGVSTNGKGVWGESPNGFAGYFDGKVFTTTWYEMVEISAPPSPASNKARLFIRDDGAGKTQLCVRFSTGSVHVLATQT